VRTRFAHERIYQLDKLWGESRLVFWPPFSQCPIVAKYCNDILALALPNALIQGSPDLSNTEGDNVFSV
jgi:hypothetical protein